MKIYNFITIFSLFLIIEISLLPVIICPTFAVPLWFAILGFSVVLNFGVWVSINVLKIIKDE